MQENVPVNWAHCIKNQSPYGTPSGTYRVVCNVVSVLLHTVWANKLCPHFKKNLITQETDCQGQLTKMLVATGCEQSAC